MRALRFSYTECFFGDVNDILLKRFVPWPRIKNYKHAKQPERSLDIVVRAVSAAVLAVLAGFKSLQGLSCAPAPATTRRGMLVTNGKGWRPS